MYRLIDMKPGGQRKVVRGRQGVGMLHHVARLDAVCKYLRHKDIIEPAVRIPAGHRVAGRQRVLRAKRVDKDARAFSRDDDLDERVLGKSAGDTTPRARRDRGSETRAIIDAPRDREE